MKISEIISLLAVQYSNSTLLSLLSRKREKDLEKLAEQFESEIESRMLSKSTLAGLKRLCPKVGSSPKLSKVLIGLGLPEKVVSLALAAPNAAALPRVSAEMQDLLEMGDSTHFISCQASNHSMRKVEQLIPYLGEHLFLWVLGERQSLSKDGFKARALLRVMYSSDKEYTQPAGLYIDRPYGQSGTLMFYISHLKEWWDNWCAQKGFASCPILMPSVWQRNNGEGNDFQYLHGGLYPKFLYCPSAEAGYNDTLTHQSGPYDCFSAVNVEAKNLHMRAYHERPWEWGAYLCSLKEHLYNAQKFTFIAPPTEKEPRGVITSEDREKIKFLISFFGYPDRSSFQRTTEIPEGVALKFNGRQVAYSNGKVYVANLNGDLEMVYDHDQKYVYGDCPDFGFWSGACSKKRLEIPGATWWSCTVEIAGIEYRISNRVFSVDILTPQGDKFLSIKRNSLVVYQDLPELGFWQAEKLPKINEPFVDVRDED